jgi:dipeptidase
LAQRSAPPLAAESKGLISRDWSRVVLPSVMSANENTELKALAS